MKYFSKKVFYNNIKFDSKAEVKYYQDLIEKEKNGIIKNIRIHCSFELFGSFRDNNGKLERGCIYTPDFVYYDNTLNQNVVIEIKSKYTAKLADYIIRRKLFKIKYPGLIFKEIIY